METANRPGEDRSGRHLMAAGSEATEAECAAGRTAPRVSLDDIRANIVGRHIVNGADLAILSGEDDPAPSLGLLTICVLVLANGFTIIGKSAPASPENFDAELGAKLAEEDAVRQVWPLMGYALREELRRAGASIEPGDGMRRYVGTKAINAKPMTRAAYNELRGWELPADENGEDAGYLVEYADGQRPNVEGFAGYVSWSPADVFERSYR